MASSTTSSLLNFPLPLFPSNTTPQIPKFSPLQNTLSSSSNTLSISSKKQESGPIMNKEEYTGDMVAVVCPSLAYSNTLFFNSAYNVQVFVDENEPDERLLNRFRREVMRAGVIQECKRRRFFENKQDKEKRKSREAAKRNSRRRRGPPSRGPFQNREEAAKVEKKHDDEDNWEMPEGESQF